MLEKCQYCEKEFKNVHVHERFCKQKPEQTQKQNPVPSITIDKENNISVSDGRTETLLQTGIGVAQVPVVKSEPVEFSGEKKARLVSSLWQTFTDGDQRHTIFELADKITDVLVFLESVKEAICRDGDEKEKINKFIDQYKNNIDGFKDDFGKEDSGTSAR